MSIIMNIHSFRLGSVAVTKGFRNKAGCVM
jgi:hypothetical protein